MAASYLSTTVQDSPYVLPVDINLLAKVNQYKQSIFYQNADKVGQELSQLNNTDIFKDNERDYLKNKVNDLTSGINDMGGLDYSDMNVANTIDNYASSIYKDPNILTAITSTQNVRQYLQNNEDIKTDPKLNKYYDPDREWFDTQNPLNSNSIINYKNSAFGKAYSGPTAPTPYLGNDFDLVAANVEKLHPEITDYVDPTSKNRFFIDKVTGKAVSPERIRAIVDGNIDGKLEDQLNVHAAYNYYAMTGGKYTKQQGINEYTNNATTLLNEANSQVATLQHDIIVEGDAGEKEKLQKRLDDLNNNYIPQYQNAITKGTAQFSQIWDQNPQSAFLTLYKNKLTNDVVNAYSTNDKTHQLIVNQEAVYQGKVMLEAAIHNKGVRWDLNGGFTMYDLADPAAGDPNATLTVMGVNNEATAALDKDKVTQQSLQAENDGLTQGLNGELSKLIQKTAWYSNNAGLKNMNVSQFANDPSQKAIVHPDVLKAITALSGSNQITPEAIQKVLDMNANNGPASNGLNLPKFDAQGNKVVSLTPNEVSYFKSVVDVLKNGANGQNILGKVDNAGEWQNFLSEYSKKQNVIDFNNSLIATAKNDIIQSATAPLTSAERDAFDKYTANPSAYYKGDLVTTTGISQGSRGGQHTVYTFTGGPTMASALHKLGGAQNINDKIDEYVGRTATRNNYYNVVLPDSKKTLGETYPTLINYITSEIGKNETPDKTIAIKKKEDVSPSSIVTDGKDYFVGYNDASDLTKGTGYAKIEPQDLAAMGIKPLPYPYLEKIGAVNGRLMHPIFVNPTITDNQYNISNGFTAPVAIQATNLGGPELNDNTYTPSIVYQGQDYFYKLGAAPTMNGAIEKLTRFIQDNKTYPTVQSMLNIFQLANKK